MNQFELDDVVSYQHMNEIITLFPGETEPASPFLGQIWLDTSGNFAVIKRCTGTNPTQWEAFTLNISSSEILKFGNNGEFKIQHQSPHSLIDATASGGDLFIRNWGQGGRIFLKANDSNGNLVSLIDCIPNSEYVNIAGIFSDASFNSGFRFFLAGPYTSTSTYTTISYNMPGPAFISIPKIVKLSGSPAFFRNTTTTTTEIRDNTGGPDRYFGLIGRVL